ncbi:hypothetical protein Hanom_Chr06g00494491 [Helianthus anomalus]
MVDLGLCLDQAGPPGWAHRKMQLMRYDRAKMAKKRKKLMVVHLDLEASANSQRVSMCVVVVMFVCVVCCFGEGYRGIL